MQASVHPNKLVQVAIAAGIGFALVVLPEIASAVQDGFQVSDIAPVEAAAGAGVAAAIRAVILYIPTKVAP